jgi:hypothetical protein
MITKKIGVRKMEWKKIFDAGISMGHECDIRNIDAPGSYCSGYPDSAIIHGDTARQIYDAYIAVDAGVPEILVVNELNKQGKKIDGIITHHPAGEGSYRLAGVAAIQKYNWVRHGADPKKADRIYKKMIREEMAGIRAGNHLKTGNAAGFLDIPLMCLHTPVDNIVQAFFEDIADKSDFLTTGDIMEYVSNLPECRSASSNGDGPYIIGDSKAAPGKIMVDMTGGMDPDSSIFPLLKKAGINTLIAMHYSQDNISSIKNNGINAVMTGHMASDSIGLNIYCDRLENMGISTVYGPGFYRHKRQTGQVRL